VYSRVFSIHFGEWLLHSLVLQWSYFAVFSHHRRASTVMSLGQLVDVGGAVRQALVEELDEPLRPLG